jgi:hypothetical protein
MIASVLLPPGAGALTGVEKLRWMEIALFDVFGEKVALDRALLK